VRGHRGGQGKEIKREREQALPTENAMRARNRHQILPQRRGTGGAAREPGKERGRARRSRGGARSGGGHRGWRRRTSGGCGSGSPLPWIGIVTRGDEDGMDTPLEKVHAWCSGGQEQTRRRDGTLLPSSSVELQKNHESGDEHSLRDFFAQGRTGTVWNL
jgi:hypothetical protein